MSENQGWLREVIQSLRNDIADLRSEMRNGFEKVNIDTQSLKEDRAENRGKTYVIVGVITIGINLLAAWLKIN